MTRRGLDIQLTRLRKSAKNLQSDVDIFERDFSRLSGDLKSHFERLIRLLETKHAERVALIQGRVDGLDELFKELEHHARGAVEEARREDARMISALESQVARLEKQVETRVVVESQEEGLEKAKTLAIFDSIIFAITNWSTEGDTAPDFELMCQSVLFPIVYERVMSGDNDYVVTEVPTSAMEVVKRGREQVKHLREACASSLVDPEAWNTHANSVQQWWTRDALPLIYGGRSEEWDEDTPLSLVEVIEWRDQPASRALHFPLIFDGMELVNKHRDQIRDITGLPDFNRNTLQTRLQP